MSQSKHVSSGGARNGFSVRGILAASATLVLVMALSWSAAYAAKYTMTIAHLYPDDLTNNEIAPAMERFRQVVESATNGEVKVEVFGNGALGSEVETGNRRRKGRRCSPS